MKNNFEMWMKKYEELIEFKKKFPEEGKWPNAKMKKKRYSNLGKWVGYLRSLYKHKKLEKEKIDLLNKIFFDFEPTKKISDAWTKMYTDSVAYHKKHDLWPPRIQPIEVGIRQGHTKYDLQLGHWCYMQRYYYKKNKLSEDKINLLNKKNFDWKEDKVSNYDHFGWNQKYNELIKFREKHPTRWPQPYNKGEEILHNFVKGQKRAYHEGFITPDRVKKLKKIGFSFDIRGYGKSSAKSEWKPIILKGENKRVEFKSSLRWDLKLERINQELEYLVVRAICGLLNSEGGLLFIGIDDKGNTLGIENDYKTLGKKQNKDGFLLQLNNLINNYIGKEFHQYFSIKIEKIDERDVCIMIISNSNTRVYLNYNKEEFCVRGIASTESLGIREAHEYINSHWKNQKQQSGANNQKNQNLYLNL